MRVKILEKCFAGTGQNLMPGQEHDLPDGIAERFIARGLAENLEQEQPKRRGRKPKVDRAIWEARSPEDDL